MNDLNSEIDYFWKKDFFNLYFKITAFVLNFKKKKTSKDLKAWITQISYNAAFKSSNFLI